MKHPISESESRTIVYVGTGQTTVPDKKNIPDNTNIILVDPAYDNPQRGREWSSYGFQIDKIGSLRVLRDIENERGITARLIGKTLQQAFKDGDIEPGKVNEIQMVNVFNDDFCHFSDDRSIHDAPAKVMDDMRAMLTVGGFALVAADNEPCNYHLQQLEQDADFADLACEALVAIPTQWRYRGHTPSDEECRIVNELYHLKKWSSRHGVEAGSYVAKLTKTDS